MYSRISARRKCACGVLCRYLSSAEISTALRPFYFSVHPDLFGKYPEQRHVNETSLQQLSALLEAQQARRSAAVTPLAFYLRRPGVPEGEFKLVKIQLRGSSARESVTSVLRACGMPTDYVEKIPRSAPAAESPQDRLSREQQRHAAEFASRAARAGRPAAERRLPESLVEWVLASHAAGKAAHAAAQPTREQLAALAARLRDSHGIRQVQWDGGWNASHIRGALQSLSALAAQHARDCDHLRGRTVVLGQFTGVSLDGEVFLNIIDVRNEWLSLIKKIPEEDAALAEIPPYEQTLSALLRGITIRRRKFMPKVSARQHCAHLRQLVTSLGDHAGAGGRWPRAGAGAAGAGAGEDLDLAKFQLVVEPDSGPLMLSPTGQFSAPASVDPAELLAFLTARLQEAAQKLTEYSINKHVERALVAEARGRLGLLALHKDDSVTPERMISCLRRLLVREPRLQDTLRGTELHVTHYYSVLSEGALCVPWNFK